MSPCDDCPLVQALATARGLTVEALLASYVDQEKVNR